jgi:hypothetical protein
MRRIDRSLLVSLLVAVLAIPAQAGPSGDWPCAIVIDPDLKPLADLAWEHSETFRRQCRTLGTRAVVIVRSASSRETLTADARITVSPEGSILARVRLNPGSRALEYLSHEIEHVIERIEGVNLLMESLRGGSKVVSVGGAFESRRAIETGLRAAQEVDEARRALAKGR